MNYEAVYSDVKTSYKTIDGKKIKEDDIKQLQVGSIFDPIPAQFVKDEEGIQWELISKDIDSIRVMEDERENIVNKFNNMLVIGYCKPEDLKGIVRMGKNKISSELIDEFFRNLDMPVESREKAKEIFFDNNGFDNFSLQPINCYAEYVNGIKNSYKKMKAISFLKEF